MLDVVGSRRVVGLVGKAGPSRVTCPWSLKLELQVQKLQQILEADDAEEDSFLGHQEAANAAALQFAKSFQSIGVGRDRYATGAQPIGGGFDPQQWVEVWDNRRI